MLLGLALAAIPLVVAVLNAAVQMRQLANTSQELVLRGVEATRSSQVLLSSIASLERTARLYQVLGDPKLLEGYAQTDDRLTATREQLSPAARRRPMPTPCSTPCSACSRPCARVCWKHHARHVEPSTRCSASSSG